MNTDATSLKRSSLVSKNNLVERSNYPPRTEGVINMFVQARVSQVTFGVELLRIFKDCGVVESAPGVLKDHGTFWDQIVFVLGSVE
jgi:hypothetical protein